MSNVWTRVVQDLETYAEEKRKSKSIIKKIINFFKEGMCNGDCRQGRAPCNCEKRYGA
jgi:hypothetical protein